MSLLDIYILGLAGVRSPEALPVQTPASPGQKGQRSQPPPKVEPVTPSKSAATSQDQRPVKTGPFPGAVADGRTKINGPLFDRSRHSPCKTLLDTSEKYSNPKPPFTLVFFFILVRISVFTARDCAPPPLFLGVCVFSFLVVSKSKRLALFPLSEEAICSGENETCAVSRAGPAVGRRGRGYSRLIIWTIHYQDIH